MNTLGTINLNHYVYAFNPFFRLVGSLIYY